MPRFIPTALLLLAAGLAAPPLLPAADSDRPWALTVFSGPTTYTRFVDMLRLHTDTRPSYLAALALSRHFTGSRDRLAWEWEVSVVRHWGLQNHLEFNTIALARWQRFPWDHRLDTSFALGAGPSYALEKPAIEAAQHDRVSKLLNQLTAEVTFRRPAQRRWSGLIRLHHRSGAGGTIHGVSGGSNFYTAGLRYHF